MNSRRFLNSRFLRPQFWLSLAFVLGHSQSQADPIAQCKYLERNPGILISSPPLTPANYEHHLEDLKKSHNKVNVYEPKGEKFALQQKIIAILRAMLPEKYPDNIADLINTLSAYSVQWEAQFPFAELSLDSFSHHFLRASTDPGKQQKKDRKVSFMEGSSSDEPMDTASSLQPDEPDSEIPSRKSVAAILLYRVIYFEYSVGFAIQFRGKVTYFLCWLNTGLIPSSTHLLPEATAIPTLETTPFDLSVEWMMHSMTLNSASFD